MDAFVSARVPVEMKNQVGERLKEMGVTQSQLVNAAFAYVMATGELPKAKDDAPSGVLRLSEDQLAEIKRRMDQTTYFVPEEAWGGMSYKEILAEGRAADYEALS